MDPAISQCCPKMDKQDQIPHHTPHCAADAAHKCQLIILTLTNIMLNIEKSAPPGLRPSAR